jgi:hypothetical protein
MVDLLDLATTYDGARVAHFNDAAVEKDLKTEFPNSWNDKWSNAHGKFRAVAIPLSDELDFIGVIRPEIERLTRETYPSVAAAA